MHLITITCRCKADETDETRMSIIKETTLKLLHLPAQVRIKRSLAESTLLALLLLIKSILGIRPVPSTRNAPLLSLQSILAQFFTWRKPFGNSALDIIKLVEGELREPGHVLNQRLKRATLACPFLGEIEKKEDDTGIAAQNRAIFYFFKEGSQTAQVTRKAMQLKDLNDRCQLFCLLQQSLESHIALGCFCYPQ